MIESRERGDDEDKSPIIRAGTAASDCVGALGGPTLATTIGRRVFERAPAGGFAGECGDPFEAIRLCGDIAVEADGFLRRGFAG